MSIRTIMLATWAATIIVGTESKAQALTGRFQTGPITVEFSPDGHATFTGARGLLILARYRTDGSRIFLNDSAGPAACLNKEGQYEYRLNNDTLRFRVVSDECEGRRSALGNTWVRVAGATVLTHATVIDGTGAAPKTNMSIVIRDGRIAAMFPDGTAPIPADASVRDLRGQWVLPGLIDAHVHVATLPSAADRRDRVERRLRNALRGGVVAVRDMGGDARALADLARAAAAGDIVSPRIIYGAIVAGPQFFGDPRVRASSVGLPPGRAPWARAIVDTSDLRQVVAEAKGAGAGAVKLYADLDSALVRKIAAEAHRQGLGVWAHLALMPARPSDVVAGGVDVVSHSTLLAWEATPRLPGYEQRAQIDYTVTASHPAVSRVINAMKSRNTFFEPTLFVYRAAPGAPDTSLSMRREKLAANLARAVNAAGVRIVAGTDGMGTDEEGSLPNIHEELRMLVEGAGLTPMQAILAATRNNAAALGLSDSFGLVAVGRSADLLIVRADPLADIRNTKQIATVYRAGVEVMR